MTTGDDIYYLAAARLGDLAERDVQNLKPVLEWTEGSRPFAIRDCFDQSLRMSRRLLLEDGGLLELISATGEALRQPATPQARFVAEFAEGPVKAALAGLSPLRALLPIVSGMARSGRLALIDAEGKTRARAELRELQPTDGNAVILVTPQALRGYDRAFHDLVAHIRDCGGTPLGAGNLYRMIDPASIGYVAKPKIEVGREETAFDAANDLIDGYLPVARANEQGIIADLDTEFLHDYRVALRKIRSVLSLFKGVYDPGQTAELKARFSALMAPTGPLRDLDVYLLAQQDFCDLVPERMHDGLDRVFARLRDRREEEQARLAAHLRSKGYQKDIKALSKLFSKRRKLLPGPNASRASFDLACELIWKRYRRIRRIAADMTADTPDEEVHRLRIECKKLRYLMEFFGPVFPQDDFQNVLKRLKELQDSLGLFNDYAVQQIRLQAFTEDLGDEPHKLDMAQSVGAVVIVLHQKQLAEREKIVAAFTRFNSDRMQRTIRRLFHEGKGF
ncbi:CHAD domain-containing protein [Paracoccus sp. S3-43]|uniref:CHAD domain-containing protein n=1 Tax=Paracoccus sp. S3-43 TaxID=3030011 RepID=UPI0023AE88E3|nr:CHAD domain-containing protein [Paracoccus sp. S3-43]WEF24796.1 CHAD domain-containing protein [Paracoccus sp. S3-43]